MAETLKQEAKRLLANVPKEYVFRCLIAKFCET